MKRQEPVYSAVPELISDTLLVKLKFKKSETPGRANKSDNQGTGLEKISTRETRKGKEACSVVTLAWAAHYL